MEAIKLLIILFGLLFILERKPMNIIFNFIGLIITVAILLGLYNTDYLSYLLIIIYCSALTIIFGFVIMLTPDLYFAKTSEIKIYFLIPIIIFFTFFSFNSTSLDHSIPMLILDNETNMTILNKIGNLLYTEELNIFKFIIATLILILALVALFYILLPTIV